MKLSFPLWEGRLSTSNQNRAVTLEHDPVKSLKWPAMTMGFSVKDKMLFEKMTVGKKVTVDLMKDGSQYVVTDVK